MEVHSRRLGSDVIGNLVEKTQQGETDAYGELFEGFYPMVFAVVSRYLGHFEDAREVTQDVFLLGFRRIKQLKEPAAFAGWIRQIAVNTAYNFHRRRKPLTYNGDLLFGCVSKERDPLQQICAAELKRDALELVNSLTELQREALILRAVEELSYQEISERLGCPLGTAKRRIHVARKALLEAPQLTAN